MSTTSTPAIVDSIVAKPATMAAHDKVVLEEAEEYEYGINGLAKDVARD